MKQLIHKSLFVTTLILLQACGADKSPFYESILQSEEGQLRGVEIGTGLEDVKTFETESNLRDKMPNYLHYDYEISMGNTYTVTYDFSEQDELYEIEVAVFLDVIEDADVLFKNFSDYFNRKYSIGRKEDDGYMTWHTKSGISDNRVAISMINDSDAYGYLTIIVRDLDY
jgi:hypothetical protein